MHCRSSIKNRTEYHKDYSTSQFYSFSKCEIKPFQLNRTVCTNDYYVHIHIIYFYIRYKIFTKQPKIKESELKVCKAFTAQHKRERLLVL